MPRPSDFSFIELTPSRGDSEIAKQAYSLMDENVWGGNSSHRKRSDDKCATQLIAAVSSTGRVVAAGVLEMVPPDYFCVTEIATAPDYQQGHKLGSSILGMLENTAIDMGGKEITLSALPDSRTFFEMHGYQPDPAPNISSLGMIKYF